MTVVVACRAADGTLVFGSDQRFTSDNVIVDGPKLIPHQMLKGIALIGMAAENVNRGFAHVTDLRISLNHISSDKDPIVTIQKQMKNLFRPRRLKKADKEVEILCGMVLPSLQKPKLFGIFARKTRDLGGNVFCCIVSAAVLERQVDS
jgi:hypothetical protein